MHHRINWSGSHITTTIRSGEAITVGSAGPGPVNATYGVTSAATCNAFLASPARARGLAQQEPRGRGGLHRGFEDVDATLKHYLLLISDLLGRLGSKGV